MQVGTGEFVLPPVPTPKCPFLGSLATTLAEVTSIVADGTKHNLLPGELAPRVITETITQVESPRKKTIMPLWTLTRRVLVWGCGVLMNMKST